MLGFNPIALTCVAVSLGIAVMLTVRTRQIAWTPVFVALVLFSGYEHLHVKYQEFLYVDDNKDIPTSLHLVNDLYLIGLGLGLLGLALVFVRYLRHSNGAVQTAGRLDRSS